MKRFLSMFLLVVMAFTMCFAFACKDTANTPPENPPSQTPAENNGGGTGNSGGGTGGGGNNNSEEGTPPVTPPDTPPVTPPDENTGSAIFSQVAPTEGASVSLLKSFVQQWIKDYDGSTFKETTRSYYNNNNKEGAGEIANAVDDEYYPVPVTISFGCSDNTATAFVVEISLDKVFDNNDIVINTTNKSVNVSNLFVNKTYYWRVTAKFDGKADEVSKRFSFITADGIRTVAIDGVSNSRDLGGGYASGDTINALVGTGLKQMKQGMNDL